MLNDFKICQTINETTSYSGNMTTTNNQKKKTIIQNLKHLLDKENPIKYIHLIKVSILITLMIIFLKFLLLLYNFYLKQNI